MKSYSRFDLTSLIVESNGIEGITRAPTGAELDATDTFLRKSRIGVEDVLSLARTYQPGVRLRDVRGMNVQVGNHLPPPGGPAIHGRLQDILEDACCATDSWTTHIAYENLHPFTDGNGRSGRALWAWQVLREKGGYGLALGFLHSYYYQTLQNASNR